MQENQQLKVKFFKIRKNAKSPSRANSEDAGWDVFWCPEIERQLGITFGSSVLLETGIKCEIPKGYFLQVENRGSVPYKLGLLRGSCVVDRHYTGEIMINLHNVSGENCVMLEPGQKIAQLLLLPKPEYTWEEVFEDNLNQDSERGEKGFGSSGRF